MFQHGSAFSVEERIACIITSQRVSGGKQTGIDTVVTGSIRSLNVVSKLTASLGVLLMKASSEIRHTKAADGKTPQRFPEPNLLEPSARTVTASKYLSIVKVIH